MQAIGSIAIAAVIIGFTVELVLGKQNFDPNDSTNFDDILVKYDYQLGFCNIAAFIFLVVTTVMAVR